MRMFDLKKRNSLTLRSSRQTEDFRRGAVRRKDRGANRDSHVSEASNPAHLQSPQRSEQAQAHSPTTGKVKPPQVNGADQEPSPKRKFGVSVSCVNLSQNLPSSASPVKVLRSPSPGKGSILGSSSLKRGGHSPGRLSPRNRSPLMGKLRTPSPVQKKMGSFTPAESSKSWLGLQRISSEKMERAEKRAEKSLSVPNLIVCMDDDGVPDEKVKFSPLKSLQSANCNGPGITIDSSVKCSGSHLSTSGTEFSPGQINGTSQGSECLAVDEQGINDTGEDTTSRGLGSRFFCEWTKASTTDENINKASGVNENEKMSEGGGSESKEEENTEQKLYKIAKELLQTERSYVARLHLLDQVFCLRLTQEADRGSFPHEVIKNIFSNISSIYSFHSQFLLPDVENCIYSWSKGPGLGKALAQHAPFLMMYADYVRNFDQAMELVRTWTERSSAFRTIIQDIQSQDVCGNLTLQHHMLEPVQRVPRYEMLLKDYLKKLPEDNPDYELALKSLQAISMAATHSDRSIHRAVNLRRLLEIYEMVGEEEVVNPANEFLKEGRLVKLAARNTSAMERHLFLFNNFLLCCSAKFSLVGQRFTVRCRIGVDSMHVHQTTNEDHPYTFQISGKEKTLELQASSERDRDEWIKVIQEAIDVFQKKNASFKVAFKELNVEEPVEELGHRAPRWIRDNEVTLCMTCREPFNPLTRRRHHCRACGYVVCWKCSDNKVALEYDGNKLNKVCNACYAILTVQRGESMDRKKRRMLESDEYLGSQDAVMSSYLLYGDNSMIWREVWCVLTETSPPILHLYVTPQDEKPLVVVPLLGCVIEELFQGQHCFCLRQSKTCHIFSCDSLDLKQSWLTVLKLSVMRNL